MMCWPLSTAKPTRKRRNRPDSSFSCPSRCLLIVVRALVPERPAAVRPHVTARAAPPAAGAGRAMLGAGAVRARPVFERGARPGSLVVRTLVPRSSQQGGAASCRPAVCAPTPTLAGVLPARAAPCAVASLSAGGGCRCRLRPCGPARRCAPCPPRLRRCAARPSGPGLASGGLRPPARPGARSAPDALPPFARPGSVAVPASPPAPWVPAGHRRRRRADAPPCGPLRSGHRHAAAAMALPWVGCRPR
jgi:hypothetical protein